MNEIQAKTYHAVRKDKRKHSAKNAKETPARNSPVLRHIKRFGTYQEKSKGNQKHMEEKRFFEPKEKQK